MIDWQTIGILTAVLVAMGGFFLWAVNAIVAPIKVVIENNTDAVNKVVLKHEALEREVKVHGETLANHEPRIIGLEKFQDRCQEAR
jgi:hypothetical protein